MSTRNLVDPELLPLLDAMPNLEFSVEILPQIRQASKNSSAAIPYPANTKVTMREHFIPDPDGAEQLRVLVFRPPPQEGALPVLLHIHGGGYVMGEPEMNNVRNVRLVEQVNCIIVSVDYRLAPEYPHPVPLEDCYAALRWIYQNAAALGADRTRIAVGGESGGGGLSAALCLLARDRNEFPIVCQLLIYPMIDDRVCIDKSPNPFTGEFICTRENMQYCWTALLGNAPGSDQTSSYAAPSRATDLSRLPPAFIAVGTLDLFLEENLDYGLRLLRAGVKTEIHVYPGAPHGFDLIATARVSRQFTNDMQVALQQAFTV